MSRQIVPLMLLGAVASLIAAVHISALTHFWYWSYPLLDVPMHFSGGFFIGGFALFILNNFSVGERYLKDPVRNAFLAALAIGLLWEVFETATGISTGGPVWYYWYDSTKDVIMDSLGGVVAGITFAKLLKLSRSTRNAF